MSVKIILRKRTKTSFRKSLKTTVLVLASLILVVTISLGFVGNYYYDIAINAGVDREAMIKNLRKEDARSESKTEITDRAQSDAEFIFNITETGEDVRIKSRDGLNLHALEMLNRGGGHKWVIVVHGYNSDSFKMKSEGTKFSQMGYNVLMPDLRGCGESQGEAFGMGWLDRIDMLDWIDYIISKDSNAEIVLYGVSMGGATVMMTTGEPLPKNVKAAIEDCGYTSAKAEFEGKLMDFFGLPSFPVITAADVVCLFRAGYTFEQASSVEQLKKSVTPTLFIHGDNDSFVPFYMLEELYAAAACPKEMLAVKGAGHFGSSTSEPELYWDTVEKFLNKYV